MWRILAAAAALLLPAPSWANGGLTFDGSNDTATLATAPFTAGPGSIMAWNNPAAIGAGAAIFGVAASGGDDQFLLQITLAGAMQALTNGASAASTSSSSNASAGTWFLGSAVFSAINARRACINGTDCSNDTGSQTPGSIDRAGMGVRYIATPAGFFNGTIGAAAMWSVQTTDEDALAVAKGWSMRRIKPWGLVAYIPFPATGHNWFGGNLTVTEAVSTNDNGPMGVGR
jgi:hypothetical protein